MRNPIVIADAFTDLLEDTGRVEEIIKDTRLLDEAVKTYTQLVSQKALPEHVDFFGFLMHYKAEEGFQETDKPAGQFSSLLERLVIRFENSQDIFADIRRIISEPDSLALAQAHYSVLETKKPKLDQDLVRARDKYRLRADKVPRPDLETVTQTLSPRNVFGKRRVKVGSGSNGSYLDLELYAERMRQRGPIRLDPNAIIEQQLVDLVIQSHLEEYNADPSGTIAKLKSLAVESETKAEQKALNKVAELLGYVQTFDQCDTIRHKMVITRRTEKNGK
jgi:hypothetical protein